jgi:hypothetical protein
MRPMLRRRVALVVFVLSACQAKPSEPADAQAQAPASAAEPAKAEPTKAEPAKAEPAKSEPTKAEPAQPDAKAEPEPVPPPVETVESEAGADPLLAALSKGAPEAVEILALHESGRERIALYKLDVVEQWRSEHDDADELLEPLEAIVEECSSSYGEVDGACVANNASKLPGVPPEIARYAATESYAWELAHVKLESDKQASVLARKRLFEFGRACTGDDCFETKLKVYDMDGDTRYEVFAVFPVEVDSDHGTMGAAASALAFVLDKTDFHVQFATTRMHRDEGGDLSMHLLEVETSFLAKDSNGDGHPDLAVRELGKETRSGGEEEDTGDESQRINTSTVCLYERAGDRWVCPQTLGKQVIDGGALVEVTRVPLPEPTPPPTETPPTE